MPTPRSLVALLAAAIALCGCAAAGGREPNRRAAGAPAGTLAWTDPTGVTVRWPDGHTRRLPAAEPLRLAWSGDSRFLAWMGAGAGDDRRVVSQLDLASGKVATWGGDFHPGALGYSDDGLLALGSGTLVNLLLPGSRPRSTRTDLPTGDLPGALAFEGVGGVPGGLLVAAAEARSAAGGPESIYLVRRDGTTKRLIDAAEAEPDMGNVPVGSPALRGNSVALGVGARSGLCWRSDGVVLLDAASGERTGVPLPAPVGTGRAWSVHSLAWGPGGVLSATLADSPAGTCVEGHRGPLLWRYQGGRWMAAGERALRAAPGPGGQLALIDGQVGDDGDETGDGEVVLVGPDHRRTTLGRGGRELAWAPSGL